MKVTGEDLAEVIEMDGGNADFYHSDLDEIPSDVVITHPKLRTQLVIDDPEKAVGSSYQRKVAQALDMQVHELRSFIGDMKEENG